MQKNWRQAAQEAAALWRESSSVIALTGAGISVASSIPDFRSPGGLWSRHDPMEVATLQALRSRPEKVWAFLLEAMELLLTARPNPGHTALARLEREGRLKGVITQNIDGLHRKAGSSNVVEYHGSANRFYCMSCKMDHEPEAVMKLTRDQIPMLCRCGGVVRPDFVFFNEQIPQQAVTDSRFLIQDADLAVIIGTSGEVAPANAIPVQVKRRGGRVIEINLGHSSYGDLADVKVEARSEEALPYMADLIISRPQGRQTPVL